MVQVKFGRAMTLVGAVLIAGATGLSALPAIAADKVVALIPSPLSRPAFGPWVVARERGYFAAEGIEVEFQVVGGGAEIAKQVGLGNALLGSGLGDTPIVVRSRGIPVKSAALLGGGGFTQLIMNDTDQINGPADLKGKTVTVLSYQDTTYYALLGALASVGLTKNDVNIIAGGPRNIWAMFLDGRAEAMSAAPDYLAFIVAAGKKYRAVPINDYYETMAQAIMVSDQAIKERPELIRRVVRPLLHGMTDIMADPKGTVADFIKGTPENAGKDAEIGLVFEYYKAHVFPGQKTPGETDEQRLVKLQQFYLQQGIIDQETPVAELYTNEFIR